MTYAPPAIESMPRRAGRVWIVARVALATITAAAVDLALAWSYWSPHGATVATLLHAQARWVLGPHAVRSPRTVGIGIVMGWMLYLVAALGVAAALRLGRRSGHARPGRGRGVVVGVVVYAVLFQCVVPWLAFPVVPDRSPGWIGACLVVHAMLIGPLLVALLSPADATQHAGSMHDASAAIARFSRRCPASRTPA